MQFEEIQDMAISAINKSGLKLSKNSAKLIKLNKSREEIINSILILMFLADDYKFNLEDNLLNRIEEILRR